ncbi:uncharacterized protein V6R79_011391 [Siganus canaliculatus]
MPRKGKRSQAMNLRWQKVRENKSAPCHEPQHPEPENSEVEIVDCHQVQCKLRDQTDAACQPQVTYADVVKRGRHENDPRKTDVLNAPHADSVSKRNDSVAGPSRAVSVNPELQTSEQSVCASRSQASYRYGQNRQKQCTCNSLTFLAFLHEDENLSRADLDLILDKGDELYTEARKRVPDHIYLTTDELPDEVPARRSVQFADMTQLSKYGTFGETLPGQAARGFLDLEAGMSCLLSDVQYALLLMRNLCIAVFRTRSGRYGFFDPHPRTARGLPPPLYSRSPATAVMVTFTCLSSLIDRIKQYHNMLDTQSSCNYELKPVTFFSDEAPDRESEATSESAAGSLALPHRNPVEDVQTSPTQMNPVRDLMENPVHDMDTKTSSESILHSGSSSKPPQCDRVSYVSQLSRTNFTLDISSKLSKLSKDQRQKYKRRLLMAEKVRHPKENKKCKEKEKYATDETYRAKKKSHANKLYAMNSELQQKKKMHLRTKYRADAEFKQKTKQYITSRYKAVEIFRQKQKEYITSQYRTNEKFKLKQKEYITSQYRTNEKFKLKQKEYITSQYRTNEKFKLKQKEYITSQYRTNEKFKLKQKEYITSQYRTNEKFKLKQKEYITSQYRTNEKFKLKHKEYITSQYRDNITFRNRQQSYMTERYARDQAFRIRHRQLMRQRMQLQYENNPVYRRIHKMRCALKIKRKYKQMTGQVQQNEDMMDDDYDEDDLMEIYQFEANALCEADNDDENSEMVCADSQPQEQNDGAEAEASGPSQLCHHSTPERKVRIAHQNIYVLNIVQLWRTLLSVIQPPGTDLLRLQRIFKDHITEILRCTNLQAAVKAP